MQERLIFSEHARDFHERPSPFNPAFLVHIDSGITDRPAAMSPSATIPFTSQARPPPFNPEYVANKPIPRCCCSFCRPGNICHESDDRDLSKSSFGTSTLSAYSEDLEYPKHYQVPPFCPESIEHVAMDEDDGPSHQAMTAHHSSAPRLVHGGAGRGDGVWQRHALKYVWKTRRLVSAVMNKVSRRNERHHASGRVEEC